MPTTTDPFAPENALGSPNKEPLSDLDQGAGPLAFGLFLAVVASLLCSLTWIFSNLVGHGTFSARDLGAAFVAALPALAGSGFCALASWGAYYRTQARTALERNSLRALTVTSVILTLLCWWLALDLVIQR